MEFISDNSNKLINDLLDKLFEAITSILKPVSAEGYLDDLIGQQTIIHIILFVLVISLLFLFIFYLVNVIILLNKDKILSRFNNKYITFYIKYQLFLAKIATIYAPILILIGLITLCHGLYFLIKYQIPYGSLNIDLHTFIPSKK